MKRKMKGVLGIGLAFVLVVSLMAFAIPVLADPDEEIEPEANEWTDYVFKAGSASDWRLQGSIADDERIGFIGPIAQSPIDGDLYAYVGYDDDTPDDLFKSEDGGRTWATSTSTTKSYHLVSGEPIVDMVCSSMDEDVLYVTDGNYVYKSVDGFDTFSKLAAESLETVIEGACGETINEYCITCLDVGYDLNDNPLVFIGTDVTFDFDPALPDTVGTPTGPPSVLYIAEAVYPVEWNDLILNCYSCGGYTPYAVGVSPDFADTGEVFAVVTTSDADCDGTADDPETHVISTKGTICHWIEQAELLWDCVLPNHFDISAASRIGFPDDWSDAETLYVGVVGSGGVDDLGGDVYSVTAPSALDLNVHGYLTGCEGVAHKDIISLDVVGETEDASLIAGLYDPGDPAYLYYSTDGGWEWDHCDKCPSGEGPTYVLWVGDSAIAATAGCECAISLSCGEEVGEYFNQISLIATDIETILDMDHAPGYLSGTSPIFIATWCEKCCERLDTYSVWRYDQTYWERVFVSTLTGYTNVDWVQVSPDFDTTMAVFVANSGFDIFRSVDAGCSWKLMQYPCAPKPDITAWVVIDEDTLLCAGADSDAGTIFKTTRHGVRPWKEYTAKNAYDGVSFALSPSIDTDESVLFGDDWGQVFISEDLGEEWDEVVDASDPFDADEDTYVIFDPGYGTSGDEGEHMIYAAAGNEIWRCDIDPDAKWSKQNWKAIYTALVQATGIAAEGDTALYVADKGSAAGGEAITVDVDGTIAVQCVGCEDCFSGDLDISSEDVTTISGTFINGELVEILEWNLECGIDDWFEPEGPGVCECYVYGDVAIRGYESGAMGTIYIDEYYYTSCPTPPDDCWGVAYVISSHLTVDVSGGVVEGVQSGVVRSLNPMASKTADVVFEWLTKGLLSDSYLAHPRVNHEESNNLWLTTGTNVLWTLDRSYPTYIWVWEDPLATPVIQETPSDGAQLTSTSKVTLEWEELDDADEYEISLYRYCPQCPDEKEPVSVPNSEDTCAIIEGLEAGSTYYWKVRVAEGEPFLSKWSELWEFTTALGEVPDLCSPVCGGQDIILTTNFSWDAVSGASGYELQIVAASADGTSDFTGASTSTTDVNALASIPGLDYSTTYYWRVRAVSDGVPGAWSVCLFTTEAPPPEPVEPVEPVVIPPVEEITPMWIWVIIGIGAALMIAVIILIVSTRRVP